MAAKNPKKTKSDTDAAAPAADDPSKATSGSTPIEISHHQIIGHMSSPSLSDKETDQPEVPSAPTAPKRIVLKPIENSPASADDAKTGATPGSEPNEPTKPAPKATAAPTPAPTEPADDEEHITDQDAAKIKQDTDRAAEDAAKREEELQAYIRDGKYHVPTNSVAQRHAINNSWRLTILLFLLGLVLINFMLDAGMIVLLEKIPHTNFFGLNN